MALVMLALPGAVFIYNGQELGLSNVELPDEALQDPVWARSGGKERGRDGVRVPIPWEGSEPPFGFSDTPDTWLPMPREWAQLTVERQLLAPDSTLNFFRAALQLRATRPEFEGATLEWLKAPPGALIFRVLPRVLPRALPRVLPEVPPGGLLCALNAGARPIKLPSGTLLLSTQPLTAGRLPPDAAAWLV
jgi:alpha-glucosidase